MGRISGNLDKFYILLGGLVLVFLTFLLRIDISAIFLIIGFMFYFMFSPRLVKKEKVRTYTVLFLLLVAYIFTAKKIIDYGLAPAYIPVVGFVMLLAILFNDLELTFTVCVMISCFAGVVSGGSLLLSIIFLSTGMIAAMLVWHLKRRIRILTASLCAGIIQMLLFMAIYRVDLKFAMPNFLSGLLCGIVVTGILPLFENLFGIVTNISLLELSDFNHPLLKRMILEAPGTYHHSLIVGNLAEAAAESVGANPLLARIGAYYHDIGKLAKSEYFMENQRDAGKHLDLAPSMSKMVIMNHVKEGLELAKKYRLKPVITDFISQHHGTSLVYYFYRKALEEIEQDQLIHEEGFRYPGPKPTSKETAIVLLADSVEAASRVVDDPQPAKIEDVVHKIINNKFIDGQFDDCDLTLKDLEKIAKVFIHMLGGIYHGRIKYPQDAPKEGGHKKHDHLSSASKQAQDKKNRLRNS